MATLSGMIAGIARAADKFIFLAVRRGNTHQSNSLLRLHTEPLSVRLASYG